MKKVIIILSVTVTGKLLRKSVADSGLHYAAKHSHMMWGRWSNHLLLLYRTLPILGQMQLRIGGWVTPKFPTEWTQQVRFPAPCRLTINWFSVTRIKRKKNWWGLCNKFRESMVILRDTIAYTIAKHIGQMGSQMVLPELQITAQPCPHKQQVYRWPRHVTMAYPPCTPSGRFLRPLDSWEETHGDTPDMPIVEPFFIQNQGPQKQNHS